MGRGSVAAASSDASWNGLNRAWKFGYDRFSWWQDWRGECVALIASGPSVNDADIAALQDRIHVIAIKENVVKAPWADIVYGCDLGWWNEKKGLPAYKGIKISQALSQFKDMKKIEVKNQDRILTDEPGVLGSGGNSGFQALNLAIQFGATGILLIGYDMNSRGGLHWYGRNTSYYMSNPDENNFRRWRAAYNAVALDLERNGIQVINSSKTSDLNCFEHKTIEDALSGWGL